MPRKMSRSIAAMERKRLFWMEPNASGAPRASAKWWSVYECGRTPSYQAPTPEMLDAWLRIFGTALRELRRAAEQTAAAPPSTQASDWEAGSSRVEGGPSGQTEPADHPEAGHPPSDEAR